jgi:ADP-ribose pyrophosphatase
MPNSGTQDPHLVEQTLSSESVFNGVLLKVQKDRVLLPNGNESIREHITHPGAVVMLAFLPNGNLLFERQFRYPLHSVFLELPAGKIDPNEDPLETAKRELREETGYIATHWEHMGLMHPCIGYSNEKIEIFIARDLHHTGSQELDHNEFLEIIELSPSQAKQAVWSGEITDAKTITALYWLEKPT